MNDPTSIPSEFRTLVGLLRCAVKGCPPESDLTSADWPSVLRLARQHGVDTFLYPWLATHCPSLFSSKAGAANDSAPVAWRALFLESLARTLQRQRQLREILCAFASAKLAVIPLKGAWLSESVYDDPAQRQMSDLDLLIRAEDRDACHAQFLALGYSAKSDVLHSTFAYDQVYGHTAYPCRVEMHWHVTSELLTNAPTPDIAAIWLRTSEAHLLGQPVRQLTPEDQLAHLIQHIIHHAFAMPLRGYLDIALSLKKHGDSLDPALLERVAADWKTGRGLSFVPGFVTELFNVTLPPSLARFTRDGDSVKHTLLCHILFTLPPAHLRNTASMQARLHHAPLYARLRLALRRVFMPRTFLAATYPCARSVPGLPLAWLFHTRDLYLRHRREYTLLLKPAPSVGQNFKNAEMREELVNWLLD